MSEERMIWKLALRPQSLQEVSLPQGAEILCAREQTDEVCIWFRCDPHAPTEVRSIALVETGRAAPTQEEGRYLGTASLSGGNYILHVFEKKSP